MKAYPHSNGAGQEMVSKLDWPYFECVSQRNDIQKSDVSLTSLDTIDITFSADGKSWTGVFVPGTYVSTSGTVLTITPEPGTDVLLLSGGIVIRVRDGKRIAHGLQQAN